MVHFSVQTSQKYKWRTYNTQCLINGDNRGKNVWFMAIFSITINGQC